MAADTFREATGLSTILQNYDALLCDVWGVVHNGVVAFPEAVHALSRAREAGAIVVLLTNAPRPRAPIVAQLEGLGVLETAFDGVVTSGDVTLDLIRARAPGPMFHLGPERDLPLFEGTGVTLAGLDDATSIIATGLFDDESETPDDYVDMLATANARGLEFICANPDLVVDRGGRLIYCAGAIAARYREMGGRVLLSGKPYPPIYDRARKELVRLNGRPIADTRTLVIGDGVKTDLKGACDQQLDCLFVADGIHALDGTDGRLADLFRREAVMPEFVIPTLTW